MKRSDQEFVAQALFVFTCTGAACGQATPFSSTNPFDGSKGANSAVGVIDDGSFVSEDLPVPFVQSIAMTFGFTITALAYAMGSKSGAQINGAVTWGLAVAGELSPIQAVANIFMQCWGSVLGSGLLSLVYRKSSDRTNGLGSNRVGPGFSPRQAFLGEAIMVFILMYVVLETAVNKKNKANAALAPVAIGFAVYIGHTMLIPVDGCSLNPTRSFGPALVSYIQNRGPNYFRDFWCTGGVRNCMTTGGAPRRWRDTTAIDSTRPRRRRRKSAQGLRHRPRHGRHGRGGLLQGHQRHAGQGG